MVLNLEDLYVDSDLEDPQEAFFVKVGPLIEKEEFQVIDYQLKPRRISLTHFFSEGEKVDLMHTVAI